MSATIMRHLLTPNEPLASSSNLSEKDNCRSKQDTNTTLKPKVHKDKYSEKTATKLKKTRINEIDVKEIHEKIMTRITNLNDGRKKNLINANNTTGWDSAIQHIHKQQKLELSRVLRDMCSASHTPQQYGELINSIIPDMDIKIAELPVDVIEELRFTLNLDLDEFTDSSENCSQITISSDELSAAIDSINVKTEETNTLDLNSQENTCTGSVEIKPEDILDYDYNTQFNGDGAETTQETILIPPGECEPIYEKNQTHKNNLNDVTFPEHESVSIKEEPIGGDECDLFSNLSDSTVLYPISHKEVEELEMQCRQDNECDNNRKQGGDFESHDKDIPQSNNIQNNDNRSNSAPSEHASSQTDNSHSFVDNCIRSFIENDNDLDMNDWNKVYERVDLVDSCLKHLTEYREKLVKSVLNHCRMQDVSRNKESIGISHNDSFNVTKSFADQCSQTMEKVKTVNDEDKRVTKRRRVSDSTEGNVKEKNIEIKIEKSDNESLDETCILSFPSIADKVIIIEKINNQLILATETGNIIYVSLIDGTFVYTLDVTNMPITSMVFVRGINEFIYMYVGSLDTVLRIYDFQNKKMLKATVVDDHIRCMDVMWDYVFIGCKNGTLIRYSTKKDKIEFEEKTTGNDILVLKAAQEGPRKVLLIGHRQAPIYVRDAMSGLYLRNFSNEAITPTVYALIVNKNELYCGTAHNNILVFSFHEGKLLHRLVAADSKGISCMKIFKNLLFSGCYNGLIYIFHLEVKSIVKVLKGPGGGILSMEILHNQVVVGTLTGKFESVEIPVDVSSFYAR